MHAYLHFAPGLVVRPVTEQGYAILRGSTVVAHVWPDTGCDTEIVDCYVAFEFGRRENAVGLQMLRRGKLPVRLSYRIEKAD